MDAKKYISSLPPKEGPQPSLYRVGQRVRLVELVLESHGKRYALPQEEGVILSYAWTSYENNGIYMYVIEVDDDFRDLAGDDGLRECGEEQIEQALSV